MNQLFEPDDIVLRVLWTIAGIAVTVVVIYWLLPVELS